MRNIGEIWAGDKLKRRDEALLLERFVESETRALAALGRNNAFVLALDAQYGEGKSWFLERLSEQLALNHPVAFVDAWVDDANHEPLVSIMAALDDALQPFLKTKDIKDKLGNLTRAALPIMGKAVLGVGEKLVTRYVGDQFGNEAKEAIVAAGKAGSKKDDDSPMAAGVEKLFDGVSDVVDNAGKALLDQYRSRQRSRNTFKSNLRQLAGSIESTDADPRYGPIFVIVDELDRCRPSYAISLLEEIKHLFDVPGVAFVVALHGGQLEHSIKAVYGEGFDARSYLRRFFTRHYELRRLSIRELVESHFASIPIATQFSAPGTWINNHIKQIPSAELAGRLLSEWGATPREVQSIVDGLRLFAANWNHSNVPIELPFVLALLFSLVRGENGALMPNRVNDREVMFVAPKSRHDHDEQPGRSEGYELAMVYEAGAGNDIVQLTRNGYEDGIMTYVGMMANNELQQRFGGRWQAGSEPFSTWSEYRSRVRELGRFIDQASDDDESH
jgi:hypothetical protein